MSNQAVFPIPCNLRNGPLMLGKAVLPGVLKDEQVQVKGKGKPDVVSQTPVSCHPPRTSPGTPELAR